jgi:hypothetical protein
MNITQPLVNGVGNNIEDQRVVNGNKTIDRIVDDFAYSRHCCFFVKGKRTKVQRQSLMSYFYLA